MHEIQSLIENRSHIILGPLNIDICFFFCAFVLVKSDNKRVQSGWEECNKVEITRSTLLQSLGNGQHIEVICKLYPSVARYAAQIA